MRLFFALWPPLELARSLAEYAGRLHGPCGGRVMPEPNIHMTLAFLGELPPGRLADAIGAGHGAQGIARAGSIRLGAVRHWKSGGVIWAGPSEPVPCVLFIAAALREELEARGFALEEKTFVPHVTLLRKAAAGAPFAQPPSIEWPVLEFLLVRSDQAANGAVYTPVERFPLRP